MQPVALTDDELIETLFVDGEAFQKSPL